LRSSITLKLIICLIFYSSSFALSPGIWDNLEPGPYNIGFRTMESTDWSRAIVPKQDYFGRSVEGNRARQIQICVWYPAGDTGGIPGMVYGEYSYPYPEDWNFVNLVAGFQNREIEALTSYLGGNRTSVQDLMNFQMAAKKDAPIAEGKFPLIVYLPSWSRGYSENAHLCEYLASYGYVVATTHAFGTFNLNPEKSSIDLISQVIDAEYLIGQLHDMPGLNKNKLAIMGLEFGGVTAILTAMHNTDVDAIIFISPDHLSEDDCDLIRNNPFFIPARMKIPLLTIMTAADEVPNRFLFDSLKYSNRHQLELNRPETRDFTSYSLLTSVITADNTKHFPVAYEMLCQSAGIFLDSKLKSDIAKSELLPLDTLESIYEGTVSYSYQKAIKPPPTEREFMTILTEDGVEKAMVIYEQFKNELSGRPLAPENVLNAIGYGLLGRGEIEGAYKVLKLNTEFYPNSANTWDSFSEACMAMGQVDSAIIVLHKALEILPLDKTTDPQLKEAIKRHAEELLSRQESEN